MGARNQVARRERFDAVFSAHYAAVLRYAVRRVGETSAPEVVAETFLVAWRRLPEVPDNALPWLYATARRVAANERRRRARASRLAHRVEADRAHDAVRDVAETVTQRAWVLELLEQLPDRDREVLLLTEWEQLCPDDAARALGCSAAAYRVRLHRARRRFRELVAAERAQSESTGICATPPAAEEARHD
jgi:RNA polymerase sigma-70 factor, ECF subfamily